MWQKTAWKRTFGIGARRIYRDVLQHIALEGKVLQKRRCGWKKMEQVVESAKNGANIRQKSAFLETQNEHIQQITDKTDTLLYPASG